VTELSPWQQYKKNLGTTRPWHVLWHENHATTKVVQERMLVCTSCPEYIELTSQCKKCGCIMQLKTKLKEATCPLGKW